MPERDLERSAAPERPFGSPPPPVEPVGRASGRPKRIAVACVVLLTGLGWIYLGWMAARMPGTGSVAPSAVGLLDRLLHPGGADDFGHALLSALCGPTFGMDQGMTGAAIFLLLMWAAMVLAMMIPTAGAMILTYAEIAETAARKGERIVSPLVLTAGYATIWLGFALVATLLQTLLTRAAALDSGMAAASPLFAGAIFLGAGLYQFSALKHACVTLCQRPFPFFLANWSNDRGGVFRLGLRQGVYCLGCCWATMLVMFAVGVMNVVWMAVLGAVMAGEKIATSTRFSHIVGAACVAIGVAFIVTSVASHWPAGPA
jgi:predicted metal-binding membrane protein